MPQSVLSTSNCCHCARPVRKGWSWALNRGLSAALALLSCLPSASSKAQSIPLENILTQGAVTQLLQPPETLDRCSTVLVCKSYALRMRKTWRVQESAPYQTGAHGYRVKPAPLAVVNST